jgi:phosphotransferase system enzyme I (PtsI)
MAGDTRYTMMLLALGLTDFSMHPSSLLDVRQVIARCDYKMLRATAKTLLRAQSRAGIERVLENWRVD